MGREASSPIFRGAGIGVLSVGKKYLLTGTCTSDGGTTDTAVDNRQLDEEVENSGGSFNVSRIRLGRRRKCSYTGCRWGRPGSGGNPARQG